MSVIPNVTVEWSRSPRLIMIPLTTREVSAQDLVDTIREKECEWDGVDDEKLIYEGVGKTALDDEGTKVAITLTLLNAQIYFMPDTTPLATGSATSDDVLGVTLTDTLATFQTATVSVGDTIYNKTTGGLSTVLSIPSETSLTMLPLTGGSPDNEWSIGDLYVIWKNDQCSISGGNVVAIDAEDTQNFIAPVFQSPNVQVVRTSSASATLQELAAIQFASYNGGITFNQSTGQAGTSYPIGTPQYPVNNIDDAKTIGAAVGLNKLLVTGTASFVTGDTLTGWELEGVNPSDQHCHTFGGGTLTDCTIRNLHTSGPLYGDSTLTNCRMGSISQLSGVVRDCILDSGTTTLSTSGVVIMSDCLAGASSTAPSINCNGTGQVIVRGFHGAVTIKSKTGGSGNSIDLASGLVTIDPTCTGSTTVVRGIGALVNNTGGMAVDASALNESQFNNTLYAIESIRQSHRGFGIPFYMNPVGGNDSYDGRSIKTAVQTFSRAQDLCTSGRGDIIYIAAESTGSVMITENVTISKEDIHFRGPGRGATIQPLSGTAMTITANNVSVTNMIIKVASGSTTDDCVVVQGKNSKLERLFVVGSETGTGRGIVYTGGDYHFGLILEVEKCGGHGIAFADAGSSNGSPREVTLYGGNVYLNGGDGIHLEAISPVSTRFIRMDAVRVSQNVGYGINVGTNVNNSVIGAMMEVYDNAAGDVLNNSTDTVDNRVLRQLSKISSKTALIPGLI
jgi:hypothetical protein